MADRQERPGGIFGLDGMRRNDDEIDIVLLAEEDDFRGAFTVANVEIVGHVRAPEWLRESGHSLAGRLLETLVEVLEFFERGVERFDDVKHRHDGPAVPCKIAGHFDGSHILFCEVDRNEDLPKHAVLRDSQATEMKAAPGEMWRVVDRKAMASGNASQAPLARLQSSRYRIVWFEVLEAIVLRAQLVLEVAGLLSVVPMFVQAQADSVIEPNSRRMFPVRLAVPGTGQMQVLTGTGIRTKTIFKVQVYAFGLYVDSPAAAQALAEWRGRPARELEKDESFYQMLLEDNFEKTLRLHMTRDVGGDDMAEAFEDALGPRVRHYVDSLGASGGEEALQEFQSYFRVEELTKETVLLFSWRPGGTLVTAVAGEVKGEIQSPALTWALFDVYLGRKPITKDGKKGVAARFPALLGGVQNE
jgi:hypothetical protein